MHFDDLNLTQIRLIAEMLRLRSVSAASDSIGLSQPAASHALAKLRKKFGDPLFSRTAKGFQPTPTESVWELLRKRRWQRFSQA